MGFSRQEYWSVLPLPSPCESITIFKFRDSLVVQWLRIHLVMQGTPVQSLVQEDPLEKKIATHYGTPLQYSCLENPMDGGAW